MLRIGITGAHGMIGFHARCYLGAQPNVQVIAGGREVFTSAEQLTRFVSQCDAILHLAGMNRGDNSEIESVNVRLTEELIDTCETNNLAPQIVFASSTHIFRDTAYARSKRRCSELLSEWAARNRAFFCNLILPHVFGEYGKPFYNSVVSTFCYQLAQQDSPIIKEDSELELIHAQEVARVSLKSITEGITGDLRMNGTAISVCDLLKKLRGYSDAYFGRLVPRLENALDLQLFNTYRSYLYPWFYPVSLTMHADSRGDLFEAVRTLNSGQTFVSRTKPGITRGNHFHLRKIERFLVVKGSAVIRIRKLFGDDVLAFNVSGDSPQFIDIPTCHTHNITNTGDSELMTLFWAHEVFDPATPDTFAEVV